MATPQEKAQCVSWFIETKSAIQVQHNFRRIYGKDPPSRNTVREWHKKFMKTGSVLNTKKSTGRPSVSSENIECIHQFFLHNPEKSIRNAAKELQLPSSTIHKVLHKYRYKEQEENSLESDGVLK